MTPCQNPSPGTGWAGAIKGTSTYRGTMIAVAQSPLMANSRRSRPRARRLVPTARRRRRPRRWLRSTAGLAARPPRRNALRQRRAERRVIRLPDRAPTRAGTPARKPADARARPGGRPARRAVAAAASQPWRTVPVRVSLETNHECGRRHGKRGRNNPDSCGRTSEQRDTKRDEDRAKIDRMRDEPVDALGDVPFWGEGAAGQSITGHAQVPCRGCHEHAASDYQSQSGAHTRTQEVGGTRRVE